MAAEATIPLGELLHSLASVTHAELRALVRVPHRGPPRRSSAPDETWSRLPVISLTTVSVQRRTIRPARTDTHPSFLASVLCSVPPPRWAQAEPLPPAAPTGAGAAPPVVPSQRARLIEWRHDVEKGVFQK